MKNIRPIVLCLLAFVLVMPLMQSCKKGDGDPFFSLYSRKARVTGDWKITNLTKTVKYGNTTIETTFDGSSKTVQKTVIDTLFYSGPDTLYTYQETFTYTGTIFYSFEKSSNYEMVETFSDDMFGGVYTATRKGIWYFLGANKEQEYKNKEILGLQCNSYTYNNLSTSYTTAYSGDNMMEVYPIYQLQNAEIIFKTHVEENINMFVIKTDLEFTLHPR